MLTYFSLLGKEVPHEFATQVVCECIEPTNCEILKISLTSTE